MVAVRAARRLFIATGIDFSTAKYDKFRVTPAPDERYSQVIYDTTYNGYSLKTFRIPLALQIPLLARRVTISARLGMAGEFSYSEEYKIVFTKDSILSGYKTDRQYTKNDTRYTGNKLIAGCDVEFKNTEGNIVLLLSAEYLSPNLSSDNQGNHFLKYGSMTSIRMGFGYLFGNKKKPVLQYAGFSSPARAGICHSRS